MADPNLTGSLGLTPEETRAAARMTPEQFAKFAVEQRRLRAERAARRRETLVRAQNEIALADEDALGADLTAQGNLKGAVNKERERLLKERQKAAQGGEGKAKETPAGKLAKNVVRPVEPQAAGGAMDPVQIPVTAIDSVGGPQGVQAAKGADLQEGLAPVTVGADRVVQEQVQPIGTGVTAPVRNVTTRFSVEPNMLRPRDVLAARVAAMRERKLVDDQRDARLDRIAEGLAFTDTGALPPEQQRLMERIRGSLDPATRQELEERIAAKQAIRRSKDPIVKVEGPDGGPVAKRRSEIQEGERLFDDSTKVSATAVVNTADPTKSTITTLQGATAAAAGTLRKLDQMERLARPEFFTWGTQLGVNVDRLKSKIQGSEKLTPEEREFLDVYGQFEAISELGAVEWIKSITGAQMSDKERVALRAIAPTLDMDFTTFSSHLKAFKREALYAAARAQYLNKAGAFGDDKIARLVASDTDLEFIYDNFLPLHAMPDLIARVANIHAERLRESNPGMSTQERDAAGLAWAQRELGLSGNTQ